MGHVPCVHALQLLENDGKIHLSTRNIICDILIEWPRQVSAYNVVITHMKAYADIFVSVDDRGLSPQPFPRLTPSPLEKAFAGSGRRRVCAGLRGGLCVCFLICCWCCLSQKVGIVGAPRTRRHPARASSACRTPVGCSCKASVPQTCPLGGGKPQHATALHGHVGLGAGRLERARRARSLQNSPDPLLCEHTLPNHLWCVLCRGTVWGGARPEGYSAWYYIRGEAWGGP